MQFSHNSSDNLIHYILVSISPRIRENAARKFPFGTASHVHCVSFYIQDIGTAADGFVCLFLRIRRAKWMGGSRCALSLITYAWVLKRGSRGMQISSDRLIKCGPALHNLVWRKIAKINERLAANAVDRCRATIKMNLSKSSSHGVSVERG